MGKTPTLGLRLRVKLMGRGRRRGLVERAHPRLSRSRQATSSDWPGRLGAIAKGRVGHEPGLMRRMGEQLLEPPFYGSRQMRLHLLRGLQIDRPHQVLCAVITHAPMKRSFLHLVTVMDRRGRAELAWPLSNTMDPQPRRKHGSIRRAGNLQHGTRITVCRPGVQWLTNRCAMARWIHAGVASTIQVHGCLYATN